MHQKYAFVYLFVSERPVYLLQLLGAFMVDCLNVVMLDIYRV